MSTKIRALFWEEMRTGGVIAAWCTTLALIGLVGVRLLEFETSSWEYLEPEVMPIAVGTVFFAIFLLLYRVGNSGHLTGGFSGRILLLPVETWRAVGLTLGVRVALVFSMSVLLSGLTHTLFPNGPALVLIFVLPALYLYIQTLDWLRGPFPLAATLGAAIAVIGGAATWFGAGYSLANLDTPGVPVMPGLLAFLCVAVVAYGISIVSVDYRRRGERVHRAIPVELADITLPTPGLPGPNGFRSPRWALLWWSLRKDVGLILPMALAVGLFFVLCGALIFIFLPDKPDYRYANLHTLLEWLPFTLLPLFAFAWGTFRGGVGLQRGVRPSLTEYLYPVRAVDMAVARLTCYALMLLLTWLVAMAVSNAAFLWSDNGLPLRMYGGALAAGETNLREILDSRLLLPLLVLLLSWSALTVGTRLYAWFFALLCTGWATMGTFYTILNEPGVPWAIGVPLLGSFAIVAATIHWTWRGGASWGRALLWLLPYALAAIAGVVTERHNLPQTLLVWAAFLLIAIPVAALLWAYRRGIAPRRHLVACAIVWLVVVLFGYPFGYWQLSGIDRQSLLACLALGGLLVLPYPALLLDVHRRRHQGDTNQSAADLAGGASWNLPTGVRTGLYVAAAAVLLALCWLRWPANPAYIEALRAKGEPATLPDLAASYGPLPAGENGALEYLSLMQEQDKLERGWLGWQSKLSSEEQSYLRDSQLQYGNIDLAPEQPVWRKDWDFALKRRELVLEPLSTGIEAAADSAYPHSRYPIDLGSGAAVGLQHLAPLRQLGRNQAMAAWMAAVEDRPDEVVRALVGIGPIAESLREEPILISQLVRIAIHEIAVSAAEQALNRTQFTESQLQALQATFATALPPYEEKKMILHGLMGERVFSTSNLQEALRWQNGLGSGVALFQETYLAYSNLVMLRCWNAMLSSEGFQFTPMLDEIEHATNPQYALTMTLLPGLDRAREAEWRCRASLGLVELSCALERYRLAQGTLPPNLEALAPDYIKALPVDPYRDGLEPLTYRPGSDGGFTVYSWARNQKDDGGKFDPENQRSRRDGDAWQQGDWGFHVAAPETRDAPSITEEEPVEEEHDAGRQMNGRRQRAERAQ